MRTSVLSALRTWGSEIHPTDFAIPFAVSVQSPVRSS